MSKFTCPLSLYHIVKQFTYMSETNVFLREHCIPLLNNSHIYLKQLCFYGNTSRTVYPHSTKNFWELISSSPKSLAIRYIKKIQLRQFTDVTKQNFHFQFQVSVSSSSFSFPLKSDSCSNSCLNQSSQGLSRLQLVYFNNTIKRANLRG